MTMTPQKKDTISKKTRLCLAFVIVSLFMLLLCRIVTFVKHLPFIKGCPLPPIHVLPVTSISFVDINE